MPSPSPTPSTFVGLLALASQPGGVGGWTKATAPTGTWTKA